MNIEPTDKRNVTYSELRELDVKLNEIALKTDDTHCAMLAMMADEKCRDLCLVMQNKDEIEDYKKYRHMMALADGAVSLYEQEVELDSQDRMRECDLCEGQLVLKEESQFVRFYECEECGTSHTKKIGRVDKDEVQTLERP